MNIIDSIREEKKPATTLQVYHRRIRVPLKSYLEAVQEFIDPWNERAYQRFIQKYLDELRDQGIVGMVRQEHDEEFVYLDAAIRYPIDNEGFH